MPKLKKSLKKQQGEGGAPKQEQQPAKVRTVPAVKKLSHKEKTERWQGCNDVAALALESEAVAPLLACRTCETLVGLFGDESPSVRLASVRALENLVLSGETEATDKCLTVCSADQLKGFYNTILGKLQTMMAATATQEEKGEKKVEGPPTDDDADTLDMVSDTMIAFIHLLSAVCYFSENVVNNFSHDTELLASLIQCTQISQVESNTHTLSTASSELLLVLCEDNSAALQTITSKISPDHHTLLQQTLNAKPMTPNQVLTQVTLAGVMWQLNPTSLPRLLEIVTNCISSLSPQAAYEKILPLSSKEQQKLKDEESAKLLTQIRCVKTSLELCVNVVCSSEAANDQEDDEEIFRSTQVGSALIGMKFGEVIGAKAAEFLAPCPSEECEIALRDPTRTAVDDLQDEFSDVESAVIVLLMNLVMVMPLSMIGSPDALWKSLQSVFARDAAILTRITGKGEARLEQKMLARLENLCQCLWTVLRKDTSCQIDVSFISSLVQFVGQRRLNRKVEQSEGLVLSVLRFISEAAQKLEDDKGPNAEIVSLCGQLSMDCLREASLEVNVEAMIAIIDIFSDDQWDDVMKKLNMTRNIETFTTFLDNKLSILRSTNAPVNDNVAPRLEMVTSNLQPFIEYKKSRGL
eukprot:TRINITY_DN1772_c0_g1_i1.p1 TRINITY_DN1772_c0_g1~~TRINITY_DN1772_c0_g1_i1.p1  ORF type:complete len:651 (+),score=189.52 TRINITY_DN1772_c0_g1_i1:42-1955(+)